MIMLCDEYGGFWICVDEVDGFYGYGRCFASLSADAGHDTFRPVLKDPLLIVEGVEV